MLLDFAEKSKGFEIQDRVKLALFLLGVKPNVFVRLKISSNLGEKTHFEKHLKEAGFLFSVSRPKSFEEVDGVSGNGAEWKIKGVWYGYDIFRDRDAKRLFSEYVSLEKKGKRDLAHRAAGVFYGYPECCVEEFIKLQQNSNLRRKFSCYEYYSFLDKVERKFPFVFHTPCSINCNATKHINEQYKLALKQGARSLFKAYSKKRSYVVEVIVESESDADGKLWPVKDGHNYALLSLGKVDGRYGLFSFTTKKSCPLLGVFKARVSLKYDYADISLGKVREVRKVFKHKRRFALV